MLGSVPYIIEEEAVEILVAGATGNVGGALVEILAEQGHNVRALARRSPGPGTFAAGVERFEGDLARAETVRNALAGVDGVFLLSGYDDAGVVEEMQRAGVSRVALLSSSAAPTGDLSNAVAAYHIRSERALESSGIAWTFLRPNTFMTNTLQWAEPIRRGDVVRAPFADVPIATNDPYDVAAVAAASLTSSGHERQAYRITGPEPLLPSERVAILSEVLERPLTFAPQSNEEARAEMSAAMPAEYVDAFFDFLAGGAVDETSVLPTVAEVTGREPRTFRQWAEAHADAFAVRE